MKLSILFWIKLQSGIFFLNSSEGQSQKIAWCVDCRFLALSVEVKLMTFSHVHSEFVLADHSAVLFAGIRWRIVCSVATATSLNPIIFWSNLKTFPHKYDFAVFCQKEKSFSRTVSKKRKEFVKLASELWVGLLTVSNPGPTSPLCCLEIWVHCRFYVFKPHFFFCSWFTKVL